MQRVATVGSTLLLLTAVAACASPGPAHQSTVTRIVAAPSSTPESARPTSSPPEATSPTTTENSTTTSKAPSPSRTATGTSFSIDCSDPSATGQRWGDYAAGYFKGYDTWSDAPNFEAVMKPIAVNVTRRCGSSVATDAAAAMNITGTTWRAVTSWITDAATASPSPATAGNATTTASEPVTFVVAGTQLLCGIRLLTEAEYHATVSAGCSTGGFFANSPRIPMEGSTIPANMIMLTTKAEWTGTQYAPYDEGTAPSTWPTGSEGHRQIPVGASIRFDDFLCTGLDKGVTCRNVKTGAGFTVHDRNVTLS